MVEVLPGRGGLYLGVERGRFVIMGMIRKIMKQRSTHYVCLSPEIVRGFGCVAGDNVMIEHPFSRGVMVVPIDQGTLAPNDEAVRMFGWMSARMASDFIVQKFRMVDPQGDHICMGCGLHKAAKRMVEVHLCEYCVIEVASGISFRLRPSQPELAIVCGGRA